MRVIPQEMVGAAFSSHRLPVCVYSRRCAVELKVTAARYGRCDLRRHAMRRLEVNLIGDRVCQQTLALTSRRHHQTCLYCL